jgi:outer membrane receptor protein involved in Fe transport
VGLPPTCDADNDGIVDGSDVSIASTRSIDSDLLDSYEIGGKFSLFDRRMTLDTAVYRIEWEGLPISATAGTCLVGYTANAGAATSEGVEFQASLLLAEGLRLEFGAGYTEAELAKPGLGAPAGSRLPGSPKVNANLAAQYDFNVVGHKAFVRVDSVYAGKFYGDLFQTEGLAAGDYIKVDARAGVTIKRLSVELFVRNATNEDAYTWRSTFIQEPLYGYRLRPRTIGIQLGYSFE